MTGRMSHHASIILGRAPVALPRAASLSPDRVWHPTYPPRATLFAVSDTAFAVDFVIIYMRTGVKSSNHANTAAARPMLIDVFRPFATAVPYR